jgi:hypothetical protein
MQDRRVNVGFLQRDYTNHVLQVVCTTMRKLKRANTARRIGGPIIDGATHRCDDMCYNTPLQYRQANAANALVSRSDLYLLQLAQSNSRGMHEYGVPKVMVWDCFLMDRHYVMVSFLAAWWPCGQA